MTHPNKLSAPYLNYHGDTFSNLAIETILVFEGFMPLALLRYSVTFLLWEYATESNVSQFFLSANEVKLKPKHFPTF